MCLYSLGTYDEKPAYVRLSILPTVPLRVGDYQFATWLTFAQFYELLGKDGEHRRWLNLDDTRLHKAKVLADTYGVCLKDHVKRK